METIIVAMKRTFSMPLLLCITPPPEKSPVRLPKPASLCCRRTRRVKITDNIIWIQGIMFIESLLVIDYHRTNEKARKTKKGGRTFT